VNPAPALPQIYYIRHGETEWSLSGKHTGASEISLNERGENEARRLAETLRGIRFDRVLVSPRQRARRTYELSGITAAAETDPDLAEWDYGDYEGKTTREIHAGRPEWNLFQDGCPGGENPEEIAARADRLVRRLKQSTGATALYSHGHFGRVLAARWVGYPPAAAQRLSLSTGSVSILGFEHQKVSEPTLALWNLPSGGLLSPWQASAH
jgi:broad specificity phosphatase PhoE